jgi:pyruvate dehydrogenase phosphatase
MIGNSMVSTMVMREFPLPNEFFMRNTKCYCSGWSTSDVLAHSLIPYVARELKQVSKFDTDNLNSPEVEKAIKTAFLRLDDGIVFNGLNALRDAKSNTEALCRIGPARAGSCALLAMFDPATYNLRVACTGDSRAVLGRCTDEVNEEWAAIPLSEDQTGFNQAEVRRITAEHPGEDNIIDPDTGRILGLAVTRAFGDCRWKWPAESLADCEERFWGQRPRPNYTTPPYLTAEPVVESIKVQSGDFLIMASDGFWDQISSEDAVKCVKLWVKAKSSGQITPGMLSPDDSSTSTASDAATGLPNEWKSTPEDFVVEDESCATHLVKNALGGKRRDLFCSAMSVNAPESRSVRDDISVIVVFIDGAVSEWLDEPAKLALEGKRDELAAKYQ